MKIYDRLNISFVDFLQNNPIYFANKFIFKSVLTLNNQNLLHLKFFSNLIITFYLGIIFIVGLTGNSLVIWTFKKKSKQSTGLRKLMLLLACIDLIICTICIPSTIYLDIWALTTMNFFCRFHAFFHGFIFPISACVLFLVAIERYLIICFIPSLTLKKMHFCFIGIGITFIGLCSGIPMCLSVRSVKIIKQKDDLLDLNTTFVQSINNSNVNTSFYLNPSIRCVKDTTYINDENYWYYQLFFSILFLNLFLNTIVLYLVIFIFVWKNNKMIYKRYGNATHFKSSWVRLHNQTKCNQIQTSSNHCNLFESNRKNSNKTKMCKFLKQFIIKNKSLKKDRNTNLPHYTNTQKIRLNRKYFDSSLYILQNIETSNLSHICVYNRKPYVKTAQILALIALNFIISYTPYLIFTTTSVKHRETVTLFVNNYWFYSIKRILFYLYFLNSAVNPVIHLCLNYQKL